MSKTSLAYIMNADDQQISDPEVDPVDDEMNQDDGEVIKVHCSSCRNSVPVNWFISSNGSLTRSCAGCRRQPPREVSQRIIDRHMDTLLEREANFQNEATRGERESSRPPSKRKRQAPQRLGGPAGPVVNDNDDDDEDAEGELDSDFTAGNILHVRQIVSDSLKSAPAVKRIQAQVTNNQTALDRINNTLSTLSEMVAALSEDRENGSEDNPPPKSRSQGGCDPDLAASLFPWVGAELMETIGADKLKPEHLVKLRNPESGVVREVQDDDDLPHFKARKDGRLVLHDETNNPNSKASAFVKSVPHVRAFAQLWSTYIAIRAFYVDDVSYLAGYNAFLVRILELDNIYHWEDGLVKYILAVCRRRFAVAAASDWALDDQTSFNTYLNPHIKRAQSSTNKGTTGRQGAGKSNSTGVFAYNNANKCYRYNLGQGCPGCNRDHICSACNEPHPRVECPTGNNRGNGYSNANSIPVQGRQGFNRKVKTSADNQ